MLPFKNSNIVSFSERNRDILVDGEVRITYFLSLIVLTNPTWDTIMAAVREKERNGWVVHKRIKHLKLIDTFYDEDLDISYSMATLVCKK